MKMRSKGFAAAVAALLWTGSAAAGTVYLPFTVNGSLGSKTYQTNLWITNVGSSVQEVELRFIPSGTSGSEGGSTARVTVGAGQTFKVLVGNPGQVGMVEVKGDDSIVYAARLDSFTPGGVIQSRGHLPLIGASDVFAAGGTAHVQGGERAVSGSASHLGIATFGSEAGACSIKVFRVDGSQIQATASVWAPDLGQRFFEDVFDILGVDSIADARYEVSCDVPFFPYQTTLGANPDSTQFAGPSAIGADSLNPVGPGPKVGELVRMDGTFFAASKATPALEVPLPIAPGVPYGSLTFEFDMFVADLPGNPQPATNFTGTVILLKPSRGGTFLAHTIRANGVNKTTLDLGNHDVVRGESGLWQKKVDYRVKAHLDMVGRQLVWEVFRNGNRIEIVTARLDNRQLMHSGEGLKLLFGLPKVYDDGAYLPPWGYRFSNLVVSGVPLS